jgi:hypothetical protein
MFRRKWLPVERNCSMTRENINGRRLVGLFLLGMLLFNFPLLSCSTARCWFWAFPFYISTCSPPGQGSSFPDIDGQPDQAGPPNFQIIDGDKGIGMLATETVIFVSLCYIGALVRYRLLR